MRVSNSAEWFDGADKILLVAPGTRAEADQARRYCARLVERAWADRTLPLSCPLPGTWEVGPDRPPPAGNRENLSIRVQWLAYLFDHLGLWPEEVVGK